MITEILFCIPIIAGILYGHGKKNVNGWDLFKQGLAIGGILSVILALLAFTLGSIFNFTVGIVAGTIVLLAIGYLAIALTIDFIIGAFIGNFLSKNFNYKLPRVNFDWLKERNNLMILSGIVVVLIAGMWVGKFGMFAEQYPTYTTFPGGRYCSDSDMGSNYPTGINYAVRGYAMSSGDANANYDTCFSDAFGGSRILREWYCYGSESWFVDISCNCQEGKCTDIASPRLQISYGGAYIDPVNPSIIVGKLELKNVGEEMPTDWIWEMQIVPQGHGPYTVLPYMSQSAIQTCDPSKPNNIHKSFSLGTGEFGTLYLSKTLAKGTYDVWFTYGDKCYDADPYGAFSWRAAEYKGTFTISVIPTTTTTIRPTTTTVQGCTGCQCGCYTGTPNCIAPCPTTTTTTTTVQGCTGCQCGCYYGTNNCIAPCSTPTTTTTTTTTIPPQCSIEGQQQCVTNFIQICTNGRWMQTAVYCGTTTTTTYIPPTTTTVPACYSGQTSQCLLADGSIGSKSCVVSPYGTYWSECKGPDNLLYYIVGGIIVILIIVIFYFAIKKKT